MYCIQNLLEEGWMEGYRAWEAERSLRARQLRGLAERVSAGVTGKRPLQAAIDCRADDGPDGPREVPVSSIVGILGPRGPRFLPIPRQSRIVAWRKMFAADEPQARAVSVEPATRGWLLRDPADALLVHVLKARGIETLVIRRRTPVAAAEPDREECCPKPPPRKIA